MKEDLGVKMSLKKGRRAFVGGLALTGVGAGAVTGLISSSARGADEASLASKTVGFGWESAAPTGDTGTSTKLGVAVLIPTFASIFCAVIMGMPVRSGITNPSGAVSSGEATSRLTLGCAMP